MRQAAKTIQPFSEVALVWAGMVLGVSFIATPAKFLAPTLPLVIALDAGRATFHSFLWVETVMALLLGASAILAWPRCPLLVGGAGAAGLILAGEGLWLLPLLDARLAGILAGEVLSPSSLHSLYIAAEVVKLLLLFGLAAFARTGGLREWPTSIGFGRGRLRCALGARKRQGVVS